MLGGCATGACRCPILPAVRSALRRAALVVAASLALPWAAALHVASAADGSTTILVLDVSGSMDDPAQIPPGFPQAAKLQADEDAVGRLLEQAHPGNRVPLSVIVGGLMGLPELITLRSDLNTYLQQQNIDPASLSKIYVPASGIQAVAQSTSLTSSATPIIPTVSGSSMESLMSPFLSTPLTALASASIPDFSWRRASASKIKSLAGILTLLDS